MPDLFFSHLYKTRPAYCMHVPFDDQKFQCLKFL
ncbi:hypothetical protein T4D_5298 [Trichinella pseudospiralis]|uniref:Uncharacterized protein n=1 Tax=Trichinella pseudospiralis TaxID=6337 RepID=A0A0V1EK32_TRIPS|nr:hypothetical protein T4D_5298 [Trichinella pseudospiralis]